MCNTSSQMDSILVWTWYTGSASLILAGPACMQKKLHWSRVFTARLTKDVKLVGSTISCEAAYMGGNLSNLARRNPHVQSYIMATDQVLYAAISCLLHAATNPHHAATCRI